MEWGRYMPEHGGWWWFFEADACMGDPEMPFTLEKGGCYKLSQNQEKVGVVELSAKAAAECTYIGSMIWLKKEKVACAVFQNPQGELFAAPVPDQEE